MRATLLLAALLMAASPVLAQTWDETGDGGGDAGDLPGTAQVLAPGVTYTTITGELDAADPNDVDLYQIYITDPANFSATTENPVTQAGTDTRLFLLDGGGNGVIFNDDTPGGGSDGTCCESTLPLGDPNQPTTPGIYFLGVMSYDNMVQDSTPLDIFTIVGFEDVVGPDPGVGPAAGYRDTGLDVGPYQIDLTGDVVPVELVSFNATVDGISVSLNWATASETNNAGFEVQVQNGEAWNALGFVDGNGTTTEAQTYSYSADMGVGTHTFRLKQIDYDGAFEYSDELEVSIETPGTHVLTSAYPNPFNPQSQFTLAVAQDQVVTAELYNTLGQRVATLFQGTVEANQAQLVTIDGAALSSGMYVVRVNGASFNDALSVTLLK